MGYTCSPLAGVQLVSKVKILQTKAVILHTSSSYSLRARYAGGASLHRGFARMASTRTLHSSSSKASTDALSLAHETSSIRQPQADQPPPDEKDKASAPLAILPLTSIVRSLLTATVSSSPLLLSPSLAVMSALAHTNRPLLNPDKNPLLRFLLKKTFYAQFCAGEHSIEVRRTIASLRDLGFSGVILGYAKEVVLSDEQTKNLTSCGEGALAEECVRTEINPWATGTMETVLLASPGDFVALKFTGAGRQALYALSHRLPPPEALARAMDSVCRLAAERGVRLLFDAEQQAVQAGIDDWTLEYMRRFNTADAATIYGTYQAYLKATPATLSRHLAAAARDGFTLGVKLVRGAYLGSDPRHLMHDTKADTDAAYDGIAAAVLQKRWSRPLDGSSPQFPKVDMVLASHNRDSVTKARAMLEAYGEGGRPEVAFAQLQGMADEVSCELLSSRRGHAAFTPAVYKYLVWGSTGECMKYLLRRAEENKDAVQRTRSGREAMQAELWRRMKSFFGLA